MVQIQCKESAQQLQLIQQTMMQKREENKFYVEIKTVTWQRDSHGLFDYENQNHRFQKFVATESCCLHQKTKSRQSDDEIKIEYDLGSELSSIKDDSVSLLNLTVTRNSVLVQQNSPSPKLKLNYLPQFLIVRSLKNSQGQPKGYSLQVGDVIKLGRIEFRVLEIKGEAGTTKKVTDHWMNEEKQSDERQEEENAQKGEVLCRVCYDQVLQEEHAPGEQQFVYVCACKGSTANIHLHCLKKWIQMKPMCKKEGNVTKYKLLKFECEVCKVALPFQIRHKQKVYSLLDLERPAFDPYIVLEQKDQNKESSPEARHSPNNVSQFVVAFDQNNQFSAKLGRGHSCEVRISDISVSRLHATINYDPLTNEFKLFDNNSKFGSLVLLQKPFTLKEERIALQVGRIVITIFLRNMPRDQKGLDKKAFQKNFFKNNKETEKEIAEFKQQVVYNGQVPPSGQGQVGDIFENLDYFENVSQLLKEDQPQGPQ